MDNMLEMGIVRTSKLPCMSPFLILMVKKNDGSNRVYVDFQNLNMITEEG